MIDFFVVRQKCLADDRPNRRIALVGREVEKPMFDRPSLSGEIPRAALESSTPRNTTPPFGVRKRNQLAGNLFGVGRQYAPVPDTNLVELGSSVLSRPELVPDPLRVSNIGPPSPSNGSGLARELAILVRAGSHRGRT